MRSSRTLFVAVLAASVVLVAGLVGTRQTEGPPYAPESVAPDGTRAAHQLLRRFAGSVTVIGGDGVPGADVDRAIVFVPTFDDDALDALADWVRAGGTAVVPPGLSSALGASTSTAAGPGARFSSGLHVVGCGDGALADVRFLGAESGTALAAPATSGTEVCRTADGQALVVAEPVGSGLVVTIAVPGAFTNEHLAEGDNAVVLTALLAPTPTSRIAHLEPEPTFGAGATSLVDLVADGVWALLAQLLVAWVVLVAWRARRLGVLVDERQPVELDGSELTVATGRLLRRNRSPDAAVELVRAHARVQLQRRLGLPADASREATLAALAGALPPTAEAGDPARFEAALFDPVTTDDGLVRAVNALTDILEDLDHVRTAN